MLREYIKEMSQKELSEYLSGRSFLINCNNVVMCESRHIKEYIRLKKISEHEEDHLVKQMLVDAKNYIIKH